MPESNQYYRLWADVDLNAIRSNIIQIQKGFSKHDVPWADVKTETEKNCADAKAGKVKTCAVVKADGYGHGAIQVAQAVSDLVDFYAVATIEEALELREGNIRHPILVLGYVHPSMYEAAVRNQIRLAVYDLEMAKQMSEAAMRVAAKENYPDKSSEGLIHIKVDTGMSRIGFPINGRSVETICQIARLPGIRIEGIFTHFANADDAGPEKALIQLKKFQSIISDLEKEGIHVPIRHCANSAAATYIREADMDMVRLGISMYGLYPSNHVRQIKLAPAMSFKSHVIMVKMIPAGTGVGYGSTWRSEKDSIIATVPVGYADGYNRGLSNKGYVLINGAKYRIAGRVCMDQMMVDVTEPMEGSGSEVKQGDEVILVGRSGDRCITMEEISELAGSFNYEFACGISKRVPRIYR